MGGNLMSVLEVGKCKSWFQMIKLSSLVFNQFHMKTDNMGINPVVTHSYLILGKFYDTVFFF